MSNRTLHLTLVTLSLFLWTVPSFADYLANCANPAISAVLPNPCADIQATDAFISPFAPPQAFINTQLQTYSLDVGSAGGQPQELPSQEEAASNSSSSSSNSTNSANFQMSN